MDVAEYRRQYAVELEQAAEEATRFRELMEDDGPDGRRRLSATDPSSTGEDDELAEAVAVLRDSDRDVQLRSAALHATSGSISGRPDLIDPLLAILGDANEPAALRIDVLDILQQSSFHVAAFASRRPDYLATLRSIIDDADAQLRRRAIAILAREKDGYVQQRLIEGIEQPSRALVPLAKAIQLLGNDVHAEHYPLLRRIAETTRNRTAKKEAVRLLAADPSSRDLLRRILSDTAEHPDVRVVSAIALQALDPDAFEAQARQIVLDESEDERLRATCISALTHFANPAAYAGDSTFTQRVTQLHERSESPQLRRATQRYLAKYAS